jgi:hypothetical protein
MTRGPSRLLIAFSVVPLVAAAIVVGCGSSGAAGTVDGGNVDTSGEGGGPSPFVDISRDGGPSIPDAFAACATSVAEATLKLVNLVFVYDKSGSMGDKSRLYSNCNGKDFQCATVTFSDGTTSMDKYVCWDGTDLTLNPVTGVVAYKSPPKPCTNGTVGGDSAALCEDPTGCTPSLFYDPAAKWVPIGKAAEAFFADAKSAGMSASLGFFPKYDTDFTEFCAANDYVTPAVPMKKLPDATSFKAAIDAEVARGNTPTDVALKGAITYATSIAKSKPNEVTAIVLVTDGDPTDCGQMTSTGQPISVVKGIASAAANDPKQPIKTYVIGIGQSLTNLAEIAVGGGTGTATLVSTSNPTKTAADFQAALDSIRGKELSCNLPLPAPPDGKTLDINAVNVIATVNGKDDILTYNKDCTGGTGWHYDDANAPKLVELCDASCKTVRDGGKLSIAFGCATKGGVIR